MTDDQERLNRCLLAAALALAVAFVLWTLYAAPPHLVMGEGAEGATLAR